MTAKENSATTARRALAVAALLSALPAQPAFAASGKDAFDEQCASCHSLGGASTSSGPSLKGVVWRKIAVLPDFPYTSGLRAKVGVWTPDRLNAYLKNTQAFAPGTDMFWDIRDDAERRAIVRYLEGLK